MRVNCIIAEYNPFHKGHESQLKYLKEKFPGDAVIAVMSGNIVQRGELAVYEKYSRARDAVAMGVDAVFELPYPWCASFAGNFARASVYIADALCADRLCFGSESGDIRILSRCAQHMISDEFEAFLSCEMQKGKKGPLSYQTIVRNSYKSFYGEDIPEGANNTLGIEYISAINKFGSAMTPVTYKRQSAASAGAAREYIKNGDYNNLYDIVPPLLFDKYKSLADKNISYFGPILLWTLRTSEISEFEQYADIDRGLASRLKNCAEEAQDILEFYSLISNKKYTDARLRRACINVLLKTTSEKLCQNPEYTLLLSANDTGRAIIRNIKKKSKISIITKPADYLNERESVRKQFEFSLSADKLYATALGQKNCDILKKSPAILN